jgi:hypothetical protein
LPGPSGGGKNQDGAKNQKRYLNEMLYFHKCFISGPSAFAPLRLTPPARWTIFSQRLAQEFSWAAISLSLTWNCYLG